MRFTSIRNSQRPVVLLLGCLVTAGLGCAERPGRTVDPDDRPSILLLVADDLGRSFVGAYGNESVPTPNLDRLAAEGLRFDAAFTPTALCRPSRWVLYTGLYPHASGVVGFNRVPRDVSLLHEVLHDNGYYTGLVAKFGSQVQEFKPFDYFVGNAETDDGKNVPALARSATEFLRQAGDRPFFLIVGFGDPHVPYPDEPYCPADEVVVPAYLPDLPEVRHALTRYYSAVERLDTGVGRVLDALEAAGRSDDTLVLFVSDHGPAFAFAKSSLYDAGVRIPMIARWPGRTPQGQADSTMVSLVDFRSTLLEVAGVTDPAKTQGHSLMSQLEGRAGAPREAVLLSHTANFEGTYPMRGLRTTRYKYVRNFEPETEFVARLEGQSAWQAIVAAGERDPELAGRIARYSRRPPEELYDLEADPAELDNRAADPAMAGTLRHLREQLRAALVEVGDPLADRVGD